MTPWEAKLWQRLRGNALGGHHFRRQHPEPPYVLDSACLSARFAVEVDGGQHTASADAARDKLLIARGWRVLRVWNHWIDREIDAVCLAILAELASPDGTPRVIRPPL